MKKIILLAVAVMCSSFPAFAQADKAADALNAGAKVLRGTLTAGIERGIARQTLGKLPVFYRAEIGNFIGSPIVNVGLPEALSVPTTQLLQARVMGAEELHGVLHSPREVYVPLSFANTSKQEMYRGINISEWGDLEKILKDGMKIDRTRTEKGISATSKLPIAITYALPEPWSNGSIPVLTRIKVTDQFLEDNPPVHFKSEHIFFEDIPAEMIPDVFVFLKIGEPGWYKAQLQEGKVTLVGVPGINMTIK